MSEFIKAVDSVLPVTVVSAIGLFLIKEVRESFKKKAEKKRIISAYKMLIAEEAMKNAWTIKTLRSAFRIISDELFVRAECEIAEGGAILIDFHTEVSNGGSSLSIVHTSLFDSVIVDLAVTDSGFFAAATRSYEALAEVEHCRGQIYQFIKDDEMHHLIGLADYAASKLAEAEDELKKLYWFCTGKDLTHKIRSFVK